MGCVIREAIWGTLVLPQLSVTGSDSHVVSMAQTMTKHREFVSLGDHTRQQNNNKKCTASVTFARQMQSAIIVKGPQRHPVPFLNLPTNQCRDEIQEDSDHRL